MRDIKQFNELAKARKGELPTNGHIVANIGPSSKTPTGKKPDLTFPGTEPQLKKKLSPKNVKHRPSPTNANFDARKKNLIIENCPQITPSSANNRSIGATIFRKSNFLTGTPHGDPTAPTNPANGYNSRNFGGNSISNKIGKELTNREFKSLKGALKINKSRHDVYDIQEILSENKSAGKTPMAENKLLFGSLSDKHYDLVERMYQDPNLPRDNSQLENLHGREYYINHESTRSNN